MNRLVYIFLFSIAFGAVPTASRAATLDFDSERISAHVGEEITVPMYVSSTGEAVSIVSANVVFPSQVVWAKSFTLAPGWLAVPGDEFTVIDNGGGLIKQTAGLARVVSELTLFGTIKFVAVGEGVAELKITHDSAALSASNTNVLTDRGTVQIDTSSRTGESTIPAQLFDIRLEVADTALGDSNDLAARVILDSFGSVPTPVDMIFFVIDEADQIMAEHHKSLVVETQAAFTKQFNGLDLPPGRYTLHLHTRYRGDITDDFHAGFTVRSSRRIAMIGSGITLIVIIATAVAWQLRRRKGIAQARRLQKTLINNNHFNGTAT